MALAWDEPFNGDPDISVRVVNGVVFINDELVTHNCLTPEEVGFAVANYISNNY